MVALINVDVYLFLAYSDLTCHLQDIQEQVFPGCTVPPESKESKFGSSNQLFPVLWIFSMSLSVICYNR